MRERALLLVLIGACLLSLLVAYRQHEAMQESFREVERLTAQQVSKSSQLQSAVKKNVELSEQITQLAEESVRHRKAAADARKAKEALEATVSRLEATLEKSGHGRAALEEKLAALESSIGGLAARLGEEREAAHARHKEIAELASGDSRVVEHIQDRLADLAETVEELGAALRENATSSTAEAERALEEVARVTARLDEQRVSFESLSRKLEVLGRMLAVDGRPFAAAGADRPPAKIDATVGAFDSERNEIALVGDIEELQPGHVVWVYRDAVVVARAEVFRVDPTARLAAARIVWAQSGLSPAEGDRAATDPPVDRTGSPSVDSSGETSPGGRQSLGEEKAGDSPGPGEKEPDPPPEGPISSGSSAAGEALNRPRPPPPPPRPDGGG